VITARHPTKNNKFMFYQHPVPPESAKKKLDTLLPPGAPPPFASMVVACWVIKCVWLVEMDMC